MGSPDRQRGFLEARVREHDPRFRSPPLGDVTRAVALKAERVGLQTSSSRTPSYSTRTRSITKPARGGGVNWEANTAPPGSGPGVTPRISAVSPFPERATRSPKDLSVTSGRGWRTHASPARLNAHSTDRDEQGSLSYLPQPSS